MDNKANVYQFVRHQESELEFEDEVDLLMSSDIVAAQISTKPISFSRERQGWIWREDRAETLGNYRFLSIPNTLESTCLKEKPLQFEMPKMLTEYMCLLKI